MYNNECVLDVNRKSSSIGIHKSAKLENGNVQGLMRASLLMLSSWKVWLRVCLELSFLTNYAINAIIDKICEKCF